jgi:N-acetylglutamate synthase-like GNAT family acetyltransferase
MLGYHNAPEGSGVDEEGWFRSGDLMERDEAGYFRLVDRKKEIYKNIKGESVAPQRVENLFRDFEAVRRVFLVGDHRPYNTVLIVPNPEYEELDLVAMSPREVQDYFRSLVVSVNRFLAPFERIIDFALLDRDFDDEHGELTPKGTFRRRAVEQNFASIIDGLYRRARLTSPELGVEIRVPNWLFQTLGLTTGDLRMENGQLVLAPTGALLTVKSLGPLDDGTLLEIGSCRYLVRDRVVDLGFLLSSPPLWLGNEELVEFAPLDGSARTRRIRPPREIVLMGRAREYRPEEAALAALRNAATQAAPGLDDLDLCARMLGSAEEGHGLLALRVIGQTVRGDEGVLRETALWALRTAAESPSPPVRRAAFQMLLPAERDPDAQAALERFLTGEHVILDEGTIAAICEAGLSRFKLEVMARMAQRLAETVVPEDVRTGRVTRSLLRFLAEYGAAHPARFEELRTALARVQIMSPDPAAREEARRGMDRLTRGFRSWLGPVQRIAVDPEEGNEYLWPDVVSFEEGIDEDDKSRILHGFSQTSLLREAVFLLSGEALLRLADIPRGGIWVSPLGQKHGKAVYRVTVHTRLQGSFDLTLNLNHYQPREELAEEIRWLLVTGGGGGQAPLVEKFGGYWTEFDLWSEEFIAGETLDRAVERLSRTSDESPVDRLGILWPFFISSAAGAYVDFWARTGRRFVLARPSPADVIIPTHDYQTGARIISIAEREPAPELGTMLDDLWLTLVAPLEERHPSLTGSASGELVLSAFLEVEGVEEGLRLLDACSSGEGPVTGLIETFSARVRQEGFIPRRLRSAIDRYHRWAELAPDAPPSAKGETLHELFETYHLGDLLPDHPDSRVRFFRETVFRDAPESLVQGLDEILEALRHRALNRDEVIDRLSALRSHLGPDSPEEYFLARLTYPHLRPGDEAGFLSTEMGGMRQTDIVVSLTDNRGRPYRIRQPINPKEVGRLHRLFHTAKLDVQFHPEHHYLVALSERDVIIGGMFFEVDDENRTAHLEKIVVGERYRKYGVGDGLMTEFFNRLRALGVETVTTGFFRPSYFYRFGFTVGTRQAGLVKKL